jgi:hypothetical protein
MTYTGRSSVVRPTHLRTYKVVSSNRALNILPSWFSSNGQQFINARFKHDTLHAVCAPYVQHAVKKTRYFLVDN